MDWDKGVIGFDVETSGVRHEYALQPWRVPEAWITVAAFTRGATSTGVVKPSHDMIRRTFEKIVEQDLFVCGWNVTFDCSWLIASGLEDVAFKIKWLDSMLLWRHLVVEPEGDDIPKTRRKSYSLESAMHEFFPDEAGFKEFTDFHTTDPEQIKLLLHRCKEDTRFAVRLGELFWLKLTDKQRRAALLEARCIPMVARANVYGIKSSAEHAETLRTNLKQKEADLRAELLEAAPEVAGVNLGSPKQLTELVYTTWGLPITRMTKGTKTNPEGNPSTDKYALYELAFIDPRARLLKEVREAKNNCTKYADATLKSLEYNGDCMIRPSAKIFGTYSGRMTYASDQKRKADKELKEKSDRYQTGVALHQWKRGKDFRRLIRVPDGFTVAELDFAGQEFRWMAVASGDERMLELCQPGEDAHSYMGAQIAGVDYHELIRLVKEGDEHAALQRKFGKLANLSFQYRIGSKSALTKARTDYELNVTEEQIKQFLSTYKSTYVGVSGGPSGKGGYWTNQVSKCRMLGYAETFAGRRVQLKGNWTGRDAWAMESTAINYPIQGSGACQKYLALAVARNLLPKYGGYFYFELHDGLFFIFPTAVARAAAEEFHKVLSNLPYKKAWGVDLPIKFPVDCKISDLSWGDLKDL